MGDFFPFSRNKCPHCSTVVRFETTQIAKRQQNNDDGDFQMTRYQSNAGMAPDLKVLDVCASGCPQCKKIILNVEELSFVQDQPIKTIASYPIWPLSSGRPTVPSEVPGNIAQDYNEACLVLPFSPKASAALSRRCLQTLLWDVGDTKEKDLSRQITAILPKLPTYIADNLDAVRNIGNFAAHEQKSKTTGTILDVEPGEADWNLDILESLFDFFYVRPKIEEKKREEINKKLAEAGKPLLKTP